MTQRPAQTFTVSAQALSQEVNGETVILDLDSENYFGLNEVGTRIWQLLGEGRNTADIEQMLAAEYDVDEKQLRQDIDELLQQLLEAGLVSPVHGTG
jgi:hypothetical protein